LQAGVSYAAEAFIVGESLACVSSSTLIKAAQGDIASGDKFLAERAVLADLPLCLPTVAAVDMERAAVAQVCHEYSVPFTVVRTVSDAADEFAAHDFARFPTQVARADSHGILKRPLDEPGR
jgi:adenosylhomocysteine nucleosidase